MKVACIQMTSSSVVADNLAIAKRRIKEAADLGAELVVLPEYFCLMARNDHDRAALAETLGAGALQDFIGQAAQQNHVWLIAGTIPIKDASSPKFFNASLAFSPEGKLVACYNKIHLFRFNNGVESYDEAHTMQAGQTPVMFDLPSKDGHIWRIALSICYDIRFPELYRHYSAQGAHVMLIPAAFTYTTGQAHWEILARARAIENLCFVAACGQSGTHENGRHTWGQTMWIDPWGKVLAEQASGEGVVMADLDFSSLTAFRSQLPALMHRVL